MSIDHFVIVCLIFFFSFRNQSAIIILAYFSAYLGYEFHYYSYYCSIVFLIKNINCSNITFE